MPSCFHCLDSDDRPRHRNEQSDCENRVSARAATASADSLGQKNATRATAQATSNPSRGVPRRPGTPVQFLTAVSRKPAITAIA